MKKEAIKIENIKHDLNYIVYYKASNASEWQQTYIVPITLLAVIVGIILKNIWIGLLIFALAIYYIIQFVKTHKEYKQLQKIIKDIDLGDISICIEKFSHITVETIYEPHFGRRRVHRMKDISMFYFMSGSGWRVPNIRHYAWSKDYYVSSRGLENISIQGDEFYHISLQGNYDIAYIYPCKNFVLEEKLRAKIEH